MPLIACLSALTIVFLWGVNFIVIKLGVSEIPPLALLAMRFSCAGLLFLPFMRWPGLKKAALIASVGFGMGFFHQGTLFLGLEIMPAGLVSVLLQANIIIASLLGWLIFKEHIGWRTWAGIALGLMGIAILTSAPNIFGAPIIGYIYILASAFFIAITYILMKQVSEVHGPTYIALMSLPIAPFIITGTVMIDGTEWITQSENPINWAIVSGSIFYQAVIISISHIFWQRLLKNHPINIVAPWTLLAPVFAIALAIPVFGEALSWPIVIGGGLTIAGVAIITFRRIQKSV